MGRYFGGRFGNMLSPTLNQPDAKAVFTLRDNYYMTRSGGLGSPATSITELNSIANWSVIPNEDFYGSTTVTGTYYNGSKFKVMYNTGTVNFDNWEYPAYGKFDLRGGDTTKDCFFQLYAWQGTPAQFAEAAFESTAFQMGVYWESSPNTDNLTNTLHNQNAVANGEAAYFATSGYGSKKWAWYGGAANTGGSSQGSTNRQATSTKDWSGANLTFIIYGESAGSNSRKVKMYHGDTLWHEYTSLVTVGRPIYMYLGAGMPNGSGTIYSNGLPKFRYGSLPAGMTTI